MFAQRVEGDALDHDHLAVANVEDRAVDEPVRIDSVAARELQPHPVHSLGSPQQAFAIRVFADLDEDLPDGTFYALLSASDFAIFDGFRAERLLGSRRAFAAVATLDLID